MHLGNSDRVNSTLISVSCLGGENYTKEKSRLQRLQSWLSRRKSLISFSTAFSRSLAFHRDCPCRGNWNRLNMTSLEPTEIDTEDRAAASAGRVPHGKDDDNRQEEIVEVETQSSSDDMEQPQSIATASGDVINDDAIDTSTDASDRVEEYMRSSRNATGLSENCDVAQMSLTITKNAVTDEDVNGDAMKSSRDAPKCVGIETVEKERDYIGDGVEDDVKNDAGDEAKDGAKDEATYHDQGAFKEVNEKSSNDSGDTIIDEAKADEPYDESRDHDQGVLKEAKLVDDSEDTGSDEDKAEAKEETTISAKAEAKEEANEHDQRVFKSANEKSMKEPKDTDIHEANSDKVRDESRGDTRQSTLDDQDNGGMSRSEVGGGTRCDEAAKQRGVVTGQDENEDDSAIKVDEDIWRYILKTNDWWNRIRSLKEELGVEIEESRPTSGEWLSLLVSGLIRSSVERAKVELRNLLSRCEAVVKTTEVPCEDNVVHSKIVRLLKAINKLPCYVSAAPELIRVTGTREEIGSCLERLQAYGVSYELDRKEATVEIPPVTSSVPPPDVSSHEESLTRELPVPIEKHLWNFIKEKRQSEIRELEVGFGVKVSTRPTNDISTVAVSISTLSPDNSHLLGPAEQALGQLLGRLGMQVVVTCVLGGDGVAKMPEGVLNMLRQDLADVDVILEVIESSSGQRPGHRLLVVGPDKEIALSQQTINRAFEKLRNDVDPEIYNENIDSNAQQMFPGPGSQQMFQGPGAQQMFPGPGAQKIFPGPGSRLGSKTTGVTKSAPAVHSAEDGHRSDGENFQRGQAGLTTTAAAAAPSPVKITVRAKSDIGGSVGLKSSEDKELGHSIANEQLSKPKREGEQTRRVSNDLPQTQSKRSAETCSDSCSKSHGSSEQPAESSQRTERSSRMNGRASPKQEKSVTFSDDGIRVFPTYAPPPSDHSVGESSKQGSSTRGAVDRPEQRERRWPEKTAGHQSEETSCTENGRPTSSTCSTCKKDISEMDQTADHCSHVLCLSCVRNYMEPAASCCPLCGNSGRPTAAATQPMGGQMLVTFSNACRLPGLENTSKGIITVTYVFKEGYQTRDCQDPGKTYPALTKTAFLPLSPAGNEVLDLLQKAFEARVTFRFASTATHPNGELVWNDILHKESIYGGPKEGGFPDPVYMERVRHDLLAKGIH